MDVTFLAAALCFLVPALALFVWWLVMLVDALRIPGATWQAVGQSQVLYVVLMAVLGVIGTILYVFIARPKLRQALGQH